MAGAGLYVVRATPQQNNDTQSGAPAGQVLTLTTGGLGTADAWKGGYVVNNDVAAAGDYQPTATGPAAPTGHAWAASSEFSATYAAWKAADDTQATAWGATAGTSSGWWQYTPDAAICFVKASYKCFNDPTQAAKDFTIEGYDGSWNVLKTVAGETGWAAYETRSWEWSCTTDYTKYRFNISTTNGGNMAAAEIEWFEGSETRVITAHDDNHVTLNGDIANWDDGDDLDIYDGFSTIQEAHDRLWTEQTGTEFAAEQIIDIYDGTYTETVALNAGLRPSGLYRLRIQAASGQSSVILTNSGLADHTLTFNGVNNVTIEGFTVKVEVAGKFATRTPGDCDDFIDVVFDGTGVSGGLLSGISWRHRFLRCTVQNGNAAHGSFPGFASGCVFRGQSFPYTTTPTVVESCVFDGCYIALYDLHTVPATAAGLEIRNCTFYNVVDAIQSTYGKETRLRLRNNIFHSCSGYAIDGGAGVARFVESDRNCFYNCTKIARFESADYTTLANWQAFTDEEGNSPDANSISTDPQLTDAPNDDFSLTLPTVGNDGSPCYRAGAGAGVVTGQNAVAFHAFHPDIGAWSSGQTDSSAPSINATSDDESGTSVTLTLAGDATDEIFVKYRRNDLNEWTEFGTSRRGSGTLQITGLEAYRYEFVPIACRNGASDAYGATWGSSAFESATTGVSAEVHQAFMGLLLQNSSVAALVGERIYALAAPHGVEMPYIVYRRISSDHDHNIEAADGLVPARIQLDCYADRYSTVKSLADAVRLAADGYLGTVTHEGETLEIQCQLISDEDGYTMPTDGGQRGTPRVIHEFEVWHAETVPTF